MKVAKNSKLVDVNGDGKADFVTQDDKGNQYVNLSYGDGTFRDIGFVTNGWCTHQASVINWADMNGDGLFDIICLSNHNHGKHWILMNDS